MQPAVEVGWEPVRQAEIENTDATSWFQSGLTRALWTITTAVVMGDDGRVRFSRVVSC